MRSASGIELFDDPAAARLEFDADSLDPESLKTEIMGMSEEVGQVSIEPLTLELAGADAVAVFRAEYTIQSIALVDYRARFVAGNALSVVVVSARALVTGGESPAVRGQVQELAELQVARLRGVSR